MKVGNFEHTELLIDTKNENLIHKTTGFQAHFKKSDDEMETLKNFQKALDDLELKEVRYGLYLIDQL
jgi:hypothetical protein